MYFYRIPILKILFIFLLLLSFAACDKDEGKAGPESPEETETSYAQTEPGTETEELQPLEIPDFDQGLITYFTGNVYILDGEEWWDVAIGDFVEKEDVIKTEMESYCEIQFGEAAVVKIQENTELAMETLILQPENSNVALNMKNGSVLCKVQKLTGDKQFRVKTQTAVCGVRGTEFGVMSSPDLKTKIAVREGAVSVLPANLDVEKLKEKTATEDTEVRKVIDTIEESAPLVQANQEIEIEEEDVKNSEKTVKEIEKVIEEISQEGTPRVTTEKIAKLTKTIETKKTEITETVKPAKEISEESKEELKAMDAMGLLTIPVALEDEKAAEKRTDLVKIALEVYPDDALIEVNGNPEGRGKYSRIYNPGEEIRFTISRAGYETRALEITTSPETQKLYKISLKKEAGPITEQITVEATPNDAEIFVNGERVGKGSFTDQFERGKRLSVTVRREGYKEKQLDIEVGDGTKRSYSVSLEKIRTEIGVQTYPGDAEIYLDGSMVGEGSYKESFDPGKKLSFTIQKEGYEPQTLEVEVKEGAGKVYDVSLAKKASEKETAKEEEIVIRTTPDDAEILLNGERVGRGTFSDTFEYGRNLAFTFRADGHETENMELEVQPGSGKIYSVTLEPITETITFEATPRDADILLNGRKVATGSYTETFPVGETVSFAAKKEGYHPEEQSIPVLEDSGGTYTLRLEPLTEQVVIRTSPRNADIIYSGRTVGTGYFADEFPVGEELTFLIQEDGYKEKTVSLTVEEGGDHAYSVTLEPIKERIAINATPKEAAIYLNGSRVAEGYYSQQFQHGEQLSFRIEADGYETETITFEVDEETGKTYSVSLAPRVKPITIRTTPDNAAIYLDGKKVGDGTFTDNFQFGRQLTFIIRKEGYVDERLSFSVNETTEQTYNVTLEEEIVTETVTITTTPADASISINGRPAGKGSFAEEYEAGERLTIRAELDGYEAAATTVTVSAHMGPITLKLTPKTIEATFQFSKGQIVGEVTTDGNNIYTADRFGTLSAVAISGRSVWSIDTTNSPNENSFPVLIDGTLYFSGSREFIIADAGSGEIISRADLSGSSAHLFGRRTVGFDRNTALFPTNDTVNLIDKRSGATVKEVPVPKGSRMTPGVWGGKIVIADQQGALLILDPEQAGTVEASVTTSAVQPVASAVTIYRDKAFFSGRKGTVVCIDLNLQRILWERSLPGNASVFTDVQVGPAGAYVFSKGAVYGLSMIDGNELFAPITGVTSPPLCHNNRLYYGTPNEVVIRNAADGTVEQVFTIDDQTTARPAVTENGKLIVGTKSGKGFVINPQ